MKNIVIFSIILTFSSKSGAVDQQPCNELVVCIQNIEQYSVVKNFNSFIETVKSIDALKKPNRGDRKSSRQLNDEGLAYLNQKKYSDAVDSFRRAHESDPLDEEIITNYLFSLLKSQDYTKVLEFSKNGVLLNPRSSNLWFLRGLSYSHINDEVKSKASLWLSWQLSKDKEKYLTLLEKTIQNENDELSKNILIKSKNELRTEESSALVNTEVNSINSTKEKQKTENNDIRNNSTILPEDDYTVSVMWLTLRLSESCKTINGCQDFLLEMINIDNTDAVDKGLKAMKQLSQQSSFNQMVLRDIYHSKHDSANDPGQIAISEHKVLWNIENKTSDTNLDNLFLYLIAINPYNPDNWTKYSEYLLDKKREGHAVGTIKMAYYVSTDKNSTTKTLDELVKSKAPYPGYIEDYKEIKENFFISKDLKNEKFNAIINDILNQAILQAKPPSCEKFSYIKPANMKLMCENEIFKYYSEMLQKKSVQPVNCYQWVAKKGKNPDEIKTNVKASIFNESSTELISFLGTITDFEADILTMNAGSRYVSNSEGGNYYLKIDSETNIFDKEKITIGSNIKGYGVHIDKKQVYLTTGQKTLVPTIKAECMEIK